MWSFVVATGFFGRYGLFYRGPMQQISRIKSDDSVLTEEQHSAWARRGSLFLNSHFSEQAIALLSSAISANEIQVAQRALENSLGPSVGELLDSEPILLSLKHGVIERFGLDALDRRVGPSVGGLTAVIMLDPGPGHAWTHGLFAASHLIPPGDGRADGGGEMERIALEMRHQNIGRERLTLAAGDVWLRHPRLVRGALPGAGSCKTPRWLTAVFGRAEDLPRMLTSRGIEYQGISARVVVPDPRPRARVLRPPAAGG